LTTYNLRPDVRSFFEAFSAAAQRLDPGEQREYWAPTFLSLAPDRAVLIPREEMLAVLPRRRQLFESIGATASELVAAEEIPLDDLHTIVRTSWRWHLPAAAGSEDELVLESTYLLRRENTGWVIAVYLNHQDVTAVIAERASRRVAER
jgi:hypothetical protein